MKEINMNKELRNEQLAIEAKICLTRLSFMIFLAFEEHPENIDMKKFSDRCESLKAKIDDPSTSEQERYYAKKAFKDEKCDFLEVLDLRNNIAGWLNGECELSEAAFDHLNFNYANDFKKKTFKDYLMEFKDYLMDVPAEVYVLVIVATLIGVCYAVVAAI